MPGEAGAAGGRLFLRAMPRTVSQCVSAGRSRPLRDLPARCERFRRGLLFWILRRRAAGADPAFQIRTRANAGETFGALAGAGATARRKFRRHRAHAAALAQALAARVQSGRSAGARNLAAYAYARETCPAACALHHRAGRSNQREAPAECFWRVPGAAWKNVAGPECSTSG